MAANLTQASQNAKMQRDRLQGRAPPPGPRWLSILPTLLVMVEEDHPCHYQLVEPSIATSTKETRTNAHGRRPSTVDLTKETKTSVKQAPLHAYTIPQPHTPMGMTTCNIYESTSFSPFGDNLGSRLTYNNE